MNTQVITINDLGEIETLKQKRGVGIDLRDHGKIALKRITIIELDAASQCFYIKFLLGDLAGTTLDAITYGALVSGQDVPPAHEVEGCKPLVTDESRERKREQFARTGSDSNPNNIMFAELQFADYEDAVACEILTINAARLNGHGNLVGSADG